MASYICKCGRVVEKSTTADNTGNRDTAGCEGCPYLLPWGPDEYVAGQGFVKNVKGHECRMSPSISYASTYYGRADDKCTLRIVSLDLDFLEEMQVWINEHAEGQLSGGFSRDTIRGTDYSQAGRYCWSIYCSQNKKGMAAKAALIQHFFDSGHRRLDMTPEEEKAHILAAIEAGKAAYQRKKENMEYIIGENLENDCVYAYAAKEFWVYDKQACRWYTSGFCREQYERAKQKLSRLTPEDFLTDSSDYSLLDDYEIPSAALNALQEAVKSGKREVAPFEGTNPPTPADADASPCAPGASDVPLSPSPSAAADAVSLAAEEAPAFDYSEFDAQTVADLHLAEREIRNGRKMAEMGLQRMADGVAIAHDALCGSCDKLSQLKHGNRGENTFGAWCESLGLHRKAAYRLLQVSRLFDDSTPREQKALRELTNSVLYEASRPSAEPEAVEALKRQQVKTLKEFRALEAQIKAERQAREQIEQQLADAQREHQAERESTSALLRDEQQRRQQAEQGRIAAEKETAAAQRRADVAEKERDGARQALRGTRKQEEKWREKAQTVQAQLDQLQAQPIPSTAIDMDELEQRVSQRLAEERAKQSPEDLERAQQDSRDAYDAFILATRSIDNIWKTLRPQVGRLGALQGNAKNMLLQQLMKVKEELIHECENRQSGS